MPETLLQKYKRWLHTNVAKINPGIYILGSLAVAIAAGVGVYLIISLKILEIPMVFPFVIGFMIADILIGYPYMKEMSRIEEIEGTLPEVLKQMSDTLKSGSTYEYALREITSADTGALSKEIEQVLRKLEEGENFENSMKTLSENVDSRLVKRSVTIIVDSLKAGAGLSEVLDEISEDIRELHHISVERKTRTMMGFLFILFAGAVVAPAIFGIVATIISFLITTIANAGVAGESQIVTAVETKNLLIFLMQAYVFIEVIATSLMVALMREGKLNKSIIYAPLLLFVAFAVMTIANFASQLIIGGIGGV